MQTRLNIYSAERVAELHQLVVVAGLVAGGLCDV